MPGGMYSIGMFGVIVVAILKFLNLAEASFSNLLLSMLLISISKNLWKILMFD